MAVAADPPMPPRGTVCQDFVAATPVHGAAFTVITSASRWDTVCASDAVIAAVSDAEFGLGDGPTWDVFRTHRPVLEADVADGMRRRWPAFAALVADLPIGALFAFPMQLGAIIVGVCSAYRSHAGALGRSELAAVLRGVDTATLRVLAVRAGTESDDPVWLGGRDHGRRLVHQAIGMLAVQLGVGAEEAFSRLRAHAFAQARGVDAVAADVVARRLRLEKDAT